MITLLQADDEFSSAFCGLMLIGVALPVLFGFWGRSRAEDHDVSPWLGFAAGFFLGWIGVLIVPALKTHRIVNPGFRQPQVGYQPPPQGYAPPPQAYAPPQQAYALPQQAYAPPPQAYAPPPQGSPHGEPNEMLVADDDGYVVCPGCGARVRAERKTCMSCGYVLPAVYLPPSFPKG